LLVSQDYELFFRQSGSVEKCLIEPTDILRDFARTVGMRITFFVDAGMLCRMQDLAHGNLPLEKDLSRIKQHIESLHSDGHEIGLHVHPHWEDTKWTDGAWDFSGSRYQLRDFSSDEISDIVARYSMALKELCDGEVSSYRAGGFCVEPFEVLGKVLQENGITVDSSIVPGARLDDDDKGFDFRRVPQKSWWYFEDSPTMPTSNGSFLEIPITAMVLPFHHYWGRAFERVLKRRPVGVIGDGSSKAIGKKEIIRRLVGAGRVSELSLDAPKAGQLNSPRVLRQNRNIWKVMGPPKLLGKSSIEALRKFIDRKEIQRYDSLAGIAAAIRAGTLSTGTNNDLK